MAGGNGRRTVSKCAFAITASRNGFGMPFRFVLPSAARANIVSSSASNWRAGRTSQTKWASSSPAFQNLCGVPAGTVSRWPGAGDELLPPDPEADAAAEDLEPLLLARVHVRGGNEAVRLHEGLDHDGLAVRLAARLPEDDALAGDGILDGVSCADHLGLLRFVPGVGNTIDRAA